MGMLAKFGIEPSGVAPGEEATSAGGCGGSVWVSCLGATTVSSATVPSLAAWDSRAPLSSYGSQASSKGCFKSVLVRRMACAYCQKAVRGALVCKPYLTRETGRW